MKRWVALLVTMLCLVLASCGGSGNGNGSPVYPRYAYIANWDGSVSTYAVDPSTGRLKYICSTATGLHPMSIVIDPTGRYVYVASIFSDISQYSIQPDGTLKAMNPPTVSSSSARSITISPNGKYVYAVVEGGNVVLQYNVGTDGSLTPMNPPSVVSGNAPTSIVIDPSGKYAYVANNDDNTVSQYSIGANGNLVPMTEPTVAAGSNPSSVTVHPSGKYAYVSTYNNTLSQYTILQYTIGTNGSLTLMNTPVVDAGADPLSVTIDPSGKYAYATNIDAVQDTYLYLYSIGNDGSLTPLSPPATPTRSFTYAMAISKGIAPVTAVTKYAYAVNSGGNTVSQFVVQDNGHLTPMNKQTVATGLTPVCVTADPSGKYLYVANKGDNTVSQYAVGTDGNITPLNPAIVSTGGCPVSVTVDTLGMYVYVANSTDGTVSQYTIGTDGTLSPFSSDNTPSTFSTGSGSKSRPAFVAVDPSGWFLYVANSNDNTISQYWRWLPGGGDLNSMSQPTVATEMMPLSIAVDPAGKYAYVANESSNSVSQYIIGAGGSIPFQEGGSLTPMSIPAMAAGSGPRSVIVDPSGKYVYTANSGDNTVSQYYRDRWKSHAYDYADSYNRRIEYAFLHYSRSIRQVCLCGKQRR